MRQFYSKTLTKIALVVGVLLLGVNTKAQTNLAAGDLIFTGFDASVTPIAGGAADSFSFVLLTGITNGTTIGFSDRGYFGSGTWQGVTGTESSITWVCSGAIAAGTEVYIVGLTAYTYNPATTTSTANGTVTLTEGTTPNGLHLSNVGDQIIAFQGNTSISGAGTTNIAGINYFYSATTTSAGWNVSTATGPNSSLMPPGLTGGTSAFYTGAQSGTTSPQAGKFNCTGVPTATTASVRTAVMTLANWSLAVSSLTQPTGCTFISSSPVIGTQPSNSTICAGSNTTFTISASNVTGYQWQVSTDGGTIYNNVSNAGVYSGATTNTLTITGATAAMNGYKYQCVASNGSGNTTSNAVTLTVNSAPSISGNPSGSSICAGSNTTFTVAASNVTGYQWYESTDGGSNFNALSNAGVYSGVTTATLTITGATAGMNARQYRAIATGGCNPPAVSNAVILTINPAPAITTHPSDSAICPGSNTTFTGAATNATGYQWKVSTDGGTIYNNVSNTGVYTGATTTTLTITGATAGMNGYKYQLVATGGCTPAATSNAATLSMNGAPNVTGNPPNRTVCTGNNTTFPVTATGATSFQWQVSTDGGSNYNDISNTAPYSGVTTATLTVTGATSAITGYRYRCTVSSGCGSTNSNAGLLTVSTIVIGQSQTNVTTYGGSNGTATATPSGGISPYTYSWSPSGGSAATATGLSAGTYTVIVTDNITCQATSANYVISQPAGVATSVSTLTTFYTCSGAASTNKPFTVNGGAGLTADVVVTAPAGYEVSLSSGSGFGSSVSITQSGGAIPTTTIYVRLSASTSGTVSGNVTVASTGVTTKNVSVTGLASAVTGTTVVTDVSCFGGNNGAINLTPTGGLAPYTYNWVGGATTEDRFSLTAGNYTVTITDANGCTGTVSNIAVGQPATALSASTGGGTTNVSCFGGANGTATVASTGGTSPYSYSWSPSGGSNATATGLAAGTYTVTVTDNNGCQATRSFTITQPTAMVNATSSAQTDIACRGAATGSATVAVTGGTGAYSYSWAPSGGSAATATNLVAGTYTVTVTDANGCIDTQSFTLTQPAAVLATTAGTINNVSCNSGANGSATVIASGGTPGYTYSWNTTPPQNTATATGLASGTYTVTVTDANGCTATRNFTITQPGALVATAGAQTNVSCNGGANGSATVNVTGGTGAYSYVWSPTGGTGATASGLPAGTYTVTVKDANLCQTTQSFTITQPAALVATTSKTDVLCNGGATGTATVNASGGTAPYTYLWSPSGGTAATATGLTVGNYTCLITDANGCFITRNVPINQPSVLGATTAQVNASCASGGIASVTPFGGAGGYIYLWSPGGATTQSVSNLPAGNHSCMITDANGCTVTKNFVITTTNTLVATTFQTNILCNGGNTGTAGVIPSGAPGPYTYVWSPTGGSADTATNLSAGSYSVVITASNGCSITKNFTITQPFALVATAGAQTNVSCNGGSNGTATVAVTGGTGGYTYLWAPSGGTAASASGLAAGTYTVTVKDANLCQTTQSFTITQPAALVASVGSQTNVSCNGGINGTATVAVTGGTGAYTYLWAPSGGTAATASGLAAGTYTVTVKDANLCQTTQSFTITEPSVLTATTSQTNVLCNGGSTGTATVTASGGTAPYTYTWAPSGGTGATATGLTAGTYTCTIIDSKGCAIIKTVTLTQPAALVASAGTQNNTSCNGGANGSATVNVTGGTTPYTYDWNGTPIGDGTATISGLTAGSYTATVTDANGCTTNQIFTITQPAALAATTSQTNVSCFGASNGSATVTVTGGTGAYTYIWAPSGGTAATATGLAAGTYTCTITDANNCQITRTFTITSTQALTVTPTQTNVSCFGANNGVATVAVTGGTGTYTYVWAPSGGAAATATGLAPGNYTVTATDGNGCTISSNFTITEPAVLAATTSQTNILCNGGNAGTASVTVTGGTAGYTYLWSPSGGTAATATGLMAGNYSVLITDAKGCTLTKTFTITQPAAALSATTTQTNILCFGVGTGSATVTVSGGTPGYTYSWVPSGGTAATATGLAAGNYTCTITDANGCSITRSFTITQPATALASTTTQTNILCFGTSTGSATVTVTGGTPAYTYAWAPSGGTAATATGLAAGNYTCTITDANGCILTKTFTITQLPALVVNGSSTNITCNGTGNGVASVTVSGGTPGYTYSWSPSGGNGATATGLAAGVYVCTVTDANGCVKTRSFTIYEQPAILVTSVKTDVLCPGASTGSATVTVTGGVPNYTYLWSPSGGNSATATGLAPGTYTCTVTDVLGCSIVHTVTISGPEAWSIAITQTNVSCFGNNDGAIDLNVSGGTGPYTYTWTPSVGTGPSVSGLGVGNYSVTITDALGCSTLRNFSLSQPEELTAAITKTDVTCYGNNDGTALAVITGGTAPYTYSWTAPDGGTPNPANLVSGTYTVIITDNNGCTFTGSIIINQPLQTIVSAHPQDVTIDTGGNAIYTVNALNATEYQWQYSEDGTNWSDIADGGSDPEYSGATTNSLTITGLPENYNGYLYRVILKNGVDCMIISNSASLTLENVLEAVNDNFSDIEILEGTGGIAGNVTENDLFNGQAVNNEDITVTVIDNDGLFGATIDADGNLIVPTTATEGTYNITYSICEAAELTNCSTAEAIVVVTGVSGTADFRDLSLSIYPNPATTSVFIKIPDFSDHDNLRVNVFDLNGRLVKESRITSELQSMEVTGLESGVYIFKVLSDTAEASRRIVVQKRFE